MHCLVQSKAFDVGPLKTRAENGALSWKTFRIIEALKCHVSGRRYRFDLLDQFRQRKADPGYDHGPALYAPVPVNSLFLRRQFEYVFDIECTRPVNQSIDRYFPRA